MKIKSIFAIFILLLNISITVSCVKEDFDKPPSNFDEIDYAALDAEAISIKDLKDMLGNADTLKLGDSIVIKGNVTSSDSAGNFYKEIVIEDETGGISIQLDLYDMFKSYPVGQQIYIKCGNYYLGNDHNVIKLGGLYEENGQIQFGRIAEEDTALISQIILSPINNKIQPKTITFDQITDSIVNTLVMFENVQFIDSDTNKTWADWVTQYSANRYIVNESGASLIVRSSGYAYFAADSLPNGSGTIIGVLGKYNDDFQLYIRDTKDVNFNQDRF